ncbi:MAG TPA: LPS assembly lipoprotein LptE [Stellaceae bacterium]|nr:LPS assembly lipoprotein LptE [Stellaceae bacterium]
MPPRRTLLGWALGGALGFGVAVLQGCGWTPLYANSASGPADAELRAIRVAPVPERIGETLTMALRQSLNPNSDPTPPRYLLRITLHTARSDLGIQTQGLGTRGRFDAYATFVLSDIKSGAQLQSGNSHIADSFDILANEYSNIVAEDDARKRAVEELADDITNRLTVFLQRRAALAAAAR